MVIAGPRSDPERQSLSDLTAAETERCIRCGAPFGATRLRRGGFGPWLCSLACLYAHEERLEVQP